MDYRTIVKDFWENGFIVFENFFEDSLMDEYNKKILDHYGVNPDWEHTEEFIAKSSVEVIPWFPYREGKNYFDVIDKDQTFNEITDHLLGKDWQNLYCMIMFSKDGSKGQAWHQDCIPDDKENFNLNRLVYTHDITEETGGEIAIFPKTHKEGRLSVGVPDEDLDGQLVFRPKKGTVIFLHGHCWHKVLPVKKDRVSSNFRAVPKNTPEDITDICVYRNMLYRFSTTEVLKERN